MKISIYEENIRHNKIRSLISLEHRNIRTLCLSLFANFFAQEKQYEIFQDSLFTFIRLDDSLYLLCIFL